MKKWLLSILFCLFIYTLLMGNVSVEYTKTALVIWFEKLVPSLFMGMVLVRIFYEQGFFLILLSPFRRIILFLFQMDIESFSLVLSNLLIGFPTGAALLDEQAKQHTISVSGLKRILFTCSFATPGFLLLTCGSVLYNSTLIGLQLLCIQWLCGSFFLIITRKQIVISNNTQKKYPPAFMKSLTSSLLESGKTLYMIGGYFMLFMTISSETLEFMPSVVALLITIFSEFSNGVITIHSQLWSTPTKLILTSMLLGFGGFCVHMQVRGMTSHIPYAYRSYLLWRCAQMILCGFLAYCWFI